MAKKKVTKSKKSSQIPWVVIAIVILFAIGICLAKQESTATPVISTATIPTPAMSFDFGNQKIMLNDAELTFVNDVYAAADKTYGQHTASITNKSINLSQTRAAAILLDNPDGSGTFYYLVGASLIDGKESYSTPVLLGDRIKVQSVTVDNMGAEDNGIITVNYLTHAAEDALATEPTEKVTARYAFQDDGNLIEVLH